MASEVDDRIVAMEFDNKAFEAKLQTTLQSLEKLQKSLDFANSAKGMNELSAASKAFDLSSLGNAVEGIAGKFSALGVTAFTVLQNITNRAVDAGLNLVKSLSVKPIMEGFEEYQVNMNSIQTILANTKDKGSNLQDVNVALDKLNAYSDKTIYNFGQMAKNIGTFTAAGVGLDQSVNAIKGISNLAAISGSSADQASSAMYQLSQALSAGKVNLMDWNSVVNAGMGGEVFKKALFETGKAMKTITDVPLGASFEDWEKKGGTFRDQMQSGWLTAEVLSTTLQGFSGDLDVAALKAKGFSEEAAKKLVQLGEDGLAAAQNIKTFDQLMSTLRESVGSGWSQTFRTVLGDFEQSKKLFTDIYKVVGGFIDRTSDARNHLLKIWADFGGRTAAIEALKNMFGALGQIMNSLTMAFRGIFPAKTAEDLLHFTANFSELMAKFRWAVAEVLPTLTRIFQGVFATLEIGWAIIKETARFFADLFRSIVPDDGGGKILDFLLKIADFMTNLNQKLVAGGGIRDFFEGLEEAIHKPGAAIDNLRDKIVTFFKTLSRADASTAIEEATGRMSSRFEHFSSIIDNLKGGWERLTQMFQKVADVLEKVVHVVGDWLEQLREKLVNVLRPGDFDAAVDVVNVGLLGGILLALKKFIGAWNQGFNLDQFLSKDVLAALQVFTDKMKLMQTELKADILIKIAAAVGILAGSLLVLSMIDSAALTKALIAMAVGFGQLVAVMKLLSNMGGLKAGTTMTLISAAMIGVATSMVILAGAITILSKIKPGDLASGLVGLTASLAVMVGAMQLMSTNAEGLIAGSIAMNAMATAMVIMAGAVKAFATISWDEMGRGMFGLATALGIVVVAMNVMPVSSTLAAGLAMIPLATGVTILAGALKLFAMISWDEMGRGLFGMATALGVIALAMNFMPPTLPLTAAGLVLVGIALGILAGAMAAIGAIETGNLVKSVLAIAGMMTILAIALNVMNGTAAGAAALLLASAALVILTGVLKTLGQMDIKELAIGLGAIAAVMAVLGIGSTLLMPAIPAILGFANAMLQLGLSFALFGAGVWLVAKGFETLAESGRAGAAAIVDIVMIIIKAIPKLLGAFVTSISETVGELATALDLVVRTVGVLLGHIIDTIILLSPKIINLAVTLISSILTAMTTLLPQFIEFGFAMLMAFLSGVRDNIVQITTMALDIVYAFTDTISGSAQRLVDTALGLLSSFVTAITGRMPDIVLMGLQLLLSFIDGISHNLDKIVEAVGMLIARFIWTAGTYTMQIIQVGANMLIWLIRGFGQKVNDVITAGVDVILAFLQGVGQNAVRLAEGAAQVLIDFLNGMAKAIRDNAAEIRKAGLNIADAILDGVTGGLVDLGKVNKVIDAAKGVATKIVDGFKSVIPFASPSPLFIQIGKWIVEGLGIGLKQTKMAEDAAANLGDRTLNSFQSVLDRIPDTLGDIREFNPTVRPVLDLSNVYAGAKGLDALMKMATIVPEVSFDQARHISATREADLEGTDGGGNDSGGDVIFNQYNTSPLALNTNDIYKKTRSQIALAKEELGIPS